MRAYFLVGLSVACECQFMKCKLDIGITCKVLWLRGMTLLNLKMVI